jgi:hypothetical protein
LKLRIQGNSLRFRLARTEVACLHDNGQVEYSIGFPGGRKLRYSVTASRSAAAVSVNYDGDSLDVLLPAAVATAWAESDDITIEGSDSGLRILIEKDFQCIHKPEDRDPDGYPNPLAC